MDHFNTSQYIIIGVAVAVLVAIVITTIIDVIDIIQIYPSIINYIVIIDIKLCGFNLMSYVKSKVISMMDL